LQHVFGPEEVFMDVNTIQPGEDFVEVLERSVKESQIMLVMIGSSWMNLADSNGRPRIHDPKDYVRYELACAFRHSLRVIPVLVDGAEMPSEDTLPSDLVSLARRNAIPLSTDLFRRDIAYLINEIRSTSKSALSERYPIVTSVPKDLLDRIMNTKKLRVGCIKHPPLCDFSWRRGKPSFSGLYVELSQVLCEANGLQPEFFPVDWSQVPDEVFTKELDLDLVLSIFETSHRSEKADFTAGFYKVGVTGIALKENPQVSDVDDLSRDEVRIVVTKGEAGWEYVTRDLRTPRHRLIVVESSDLSEMMAYVLTKRAHIAICDEVSCYDFAQLNPEVVHLFRENHLYTCKNSIMVRKNEPRLREWLNVEFRKARLAPSIQVIEKSILADPRQVIRKHA
jgi:hypothetical protein